MSTVAGVVSATTDSAADLACCFYPNRIRADTCDRLFVHAVDLDIERIFLFSPETRGIRREDFIDQNEFAVDQTEFELCSPPRIMPRSSQIAMSELVKLDAAALAALRQALRRPFLSFAQMEMSSSWPTSFFAAGVKIGCCKAFVFAQAFRKLNPVDFADVFWYCLQPPPVI